MIGWERKGVGVEGGETGGEGRGGGKGFWICVFSQYFLIGDSMSWAMQTRQKMFCHEIDDQ